MNPLNSRGRVAPKKIMLATDFSPASELALPHALTIARHYESTLYIAHVVRARVHRSLATGADGNEVRGCPAVRTT